MNSNFTNDANSNDEMAKKAEQFSSKTQDKVENMAADAQDIRDATYESADDVANDDRVKDAYKTKERIKEKTAEKRKKKKIEKFEVDLDKYMEFVDQTTSRHSQTTADYKERIEELVAAGCNLEPTVPILLGICNELFEFLAL